ncbi:SMAD/FHA domain-containing protein [Microdochium trichocladiopsis]|uniref:SMAD/FHA domain-containing protein n=1 Tax=Microdochium trichocladiopsis TaxID=1682393 RepID=A0A9P9BPD0_9PEZI|nr:SMAD/FHA domain-containing protein [Microdochium trichocladiopsis]KAH7029112.1 SMAD/FHA domain-containing protein [Microdochium trichocladiopsis]
MDSPARSDGRDESDRALKRHKSSRNHSRERNRSSDRRRHRRSRSPGSRRDRSRDRRRDDRPRDSDRDRDDEGAKEHRRRRSRERHQDHDRDGNRSERRDRHGSDRHRSDRHSDRERPRDGGSERGGTAIVKRSGPLPSQADSFALTTGEEVPKPKEKANFGNSGALAAASNAIAQADGSQIVLKYHEPPEARKPAPKDVWKLFVFKGDDIIDTVPLSQRSCWLVGRESAVVDMIAEHPSISKQHAVIQFRYLEKRNEFGDKIGKVKPYLIDLDSANGTLLNSKKVPESRYLELMDKDLIQFGQSTREYVIMLAPKD